MGACSLRVFCCNVCTILAECGHGLWIVADCGSATDCGVRRTVDRHGLRIATDSGLSRIVRPSCGACVSLAGGVRRRGFCTRANMHAWVRACRSLRRERQYHCRQRRSSHGRSCACVAAVWPTSPASGPLSGPRVALCCVLGSRLCGGLGSASCSARAVAVLCWGGLLLICCAGGGWEGQGMLRRWWGSGCAVLGWLAC